MTEEDFGDDAVERLWRALQRLPASARDIIEHVHLRSEPVGEYARRHGHSVPAARIQLQRAVAMLERALRPDGEQQ